MRSTTIIIPNLTVEFHHFGEVFPIDKRNRSPSVVDIKFIGHL